MSSASSATVEVRHRARPAWSRSGLGAAFDSARKALRVPHRPQVGSIPIQLQAARRWLHWELASDGICFSEVSLDHDLVDNAVCIHLGDLVLGSIVGLHVAQDANPTSGDRAGVKVNVGAVLSGGLIVTFQFSSSKPEESVLRGAVQVGGGDLVHLPHIIFPESPLRGHQHRISSTQMPADARIECGHWINDHEVLLSFGKTSDHLVFVTRNGHRTSDGWSEVAIWDQSPLGLQDVIGAMFGSSSTDKPPVVAIGGVTGYHGFSLAASLCSDGTLSLYNAQARKCLGKFEITASRSSNVADKLVYDDAFLRVCPAASNRFGPGASSAADVLVASCHSVNRKLQWIVSVFRFQLDRSEAAMMCRYNIQAPPAVSVYATLVDIVYGTDGVHSIWRDGNRDQEVYAQYVVPRDSANASLSATEVLVSSSYNLYSFGALNGVLTGASMGGELVERPHITSVASELKRTTGDASIQNIHAFMLKRIFTPELFSADTIRSVLESDVPVNVRPDSEADLPSMVVTACQQWAQAFSSNNKMAFEMDIDDNSSPLTPQDLEEAYSRLFDLCASREFNSCFAVRGSLTLTQSSEFSCIARWGGAIGVLGDVSARQQSLEGSAHDDVDHPSQVAGRLLSQYESSAESAVSQCLIDADVFVSTLIESKDSYEAGHSESIQEKFCEASSLFTRDRIAGAIKELKSIVSLDRSSGLSVFDHLLAQPVFSGFGTGESSDVNHDHITVGMVSLLSNAYLTKLKLDLARQRSVCLALASVVTVSSIKAVLPVDFVDSVRRTYLPKAVNSYMYTSLLLWSRGVQINVSGTHRRREIELTGLYPRASLGDCIFDPHAGQMSAFPMVDEAVSSNFSSSFFSSIIPRVAARLASRHNIRSMVGGVGTVGLFGSHWSRTVADIDFALRCDVSSAFFNFLMASNYYSLQTRFISVAQLLTAPPDTVMDSDHMLISEFKRIQTSVMLSQARIMKLLDSLDKRGSDVTSPEDLGFVATLIETMIADVETCAVSTTLQPFDPAVLCIATAFKSGDRLTDAHHAAFNKSLVSWLTRAARSAPERVMDILAVAEAIGTMEMFPLFHVLLQSLALMNPEQEIDVLLEHCPSLLAELYLLQVRVANLQFVDRIRHRISDRETSATAGLRCAASWIAGIESLLGNPNLSNSVGGEMIGILKSDLSSALLRCFSYAVDGRMFDHALGLIRRVIALQTLDASNVAVGQLKDVNLSERSGANSSVRLKRSEWQTCLRTLVNRCCEDGHLGWLCSLPDIWECGINLAEKIEEELENIACTNDVQNLNAFVVGRRRYVKYIPNRVNFYECLAAFQLSRFDFHSAARSFHMLSERLTHADGLPGVSVVETQTSCLIASTLCLESLPVLRQFILHRSATMTDTKADEIMSFVSLPTLRFRVAELAALRSVLQAQGALSVVDVRLSGGFRGQQPMPLAIPGASLLSSSQSYDTDALIRELCYLERFQEALVLASKFTFTSVSGSGMGAIDPLNSLPSSYKIHGNSGIGLMVRLLTEYCAMLGRRSSPRIIYSASNKSLPNGCAEYDDLRGHITLPQSFWVRKEGSKTFEFSPPLGQHIGWKFLLDILCRFDSRDTNWELHRIAAEACLSTCPGEPLPDCLIQSYCADVLGSAADAGSEEAAGGDAGGLLRLLFRTGHALDASNLASRLLAAITFNSDLLPDFRAPYVPFDLIDQIIAVIEKVISDNGELAERTEMCSILQHSVDKLKLTLNTYMHLLVRKSYAR